LSASDAGFSAYPGSGGANGLGESGRGSGDGGFRAATPNKKGQYSNAVLDELESQNDEQIGVMSGKVRMLKEVSLWRACWSIMVCQVGIEC
jgi:blocked-early-in-transport protein 1